MSTALARPSQPAGLSIYAPDHVQSVMQMAATLVKSRLTPKGIDTPEKAFYLIMKGRELGVPPIRSLERIHIIEGRTTMAAELMLELFKRRGGRSEWLDDPKDRTYAEIRLKAANGDVHIERFTLEDAKTAQLFGKDNWRKWPKAMMRARAIAAGLRALGEAEGLYDPDELGAVTSPDGEILTDKDAGPPPEAESQYAPPANDTKTPPPKTAVNDERTDLVFKLMNVLTAKPPKGLGLALDECAEWVSDNCGGHTVDDMSLADLGAVIKTAEEMAASQAKEEFRDLVECWRYDKKAKEWVSLGLEHQRSREQNNLLHTLRTERKLTDDEWRQGLVGKYNKTSSAELSVREASEVIETMRAKLEREGAKAVRKEARAREALAEVAQMLDEPGSQG